MKDLQSQLEEMIANLEELNSKFETLQNPFEQFYDNDTFIELMQISKRTAQIWRDEGMIGYSKVNNKIYYRMSDIQKLLNEHFCEAVN